MRVFKLEHDGNYYVNESLEDLLTEAFESFQDMNVGEVISIECVEMSQKEYANKYGTFK